MEDDISGKLEEIDERIDRLDEASADMVRGFDEGSGPVVEFVGVTQEGEMLTTKGQLDLSATETRERFRIAETRREPFEIPTPVGAIGLE